MFSNFNKLERFEGKLGATSATQMFRNCTSLNYVNIHCPILYTANHMFRNCTSLNHTNFVSGETFKSVTSATAMF